MLRVRWFAFPMLVAPTLVQAEATVSLKAVAKNGVAFTPTSSLNVSPNDVVTAEIYLSGWNSPPFDGSTGLLSSFEITLAGKMGVRSSGNCLASSNQMNIVPLGWDAPVEKDECPCDDDRYPNCNAAYGCVGPNHHPEQMASIASGSPERIDSVFYGHDKICALDVSSLDIRWTCMLTEPTGVNASKCQGGSSHGGACNGNANCPGGTCNSSFQSYIGTLNLKVGANACGVFTFTFDGTRTFLSNSADNPFTVSPTIQGLTLVNSVVCPSQMGPCCTKSPTGATCAVVACREDCNGPNQEFGIVGYTCGNMVPPCGCPGPAGACCTSIIGVCTNNVCPDDCMEQNQRFGGAGSICATMYPPCIDGDPIPTTISPANCIIDARRPFPPGTPAQRQGFTSQAWTFSYPPGVTADALADFTVRQVPSITPPLPPTIASVTQGPGNTVTVNFSAPIQPNKWTCVKHNLSNIESCIGYLPGDVNGDSRVSPNDILDLVDNLNGMRIPPYNLNMCDIDRSGLCRAADILAEIDLLNGASGFPIQNGKTLPPCPSAAP